MSFSRFSKKCYYEISYLSKVPIFMHSDMRVYEIHLEAHIWCKAVIINWKCCLVIYTESIFVEFWLCSGTRNWFRIKRRQSVWQLYKASSHWLSLYPDWYASRNPRGKFKFIFINSKLTSDGPKVFSHHCILINFTHIHGPYHVSCTQGIQYI